MEENTSKYSHPIKKDNKKLTVSGSSDGNLLEESMVLEENQIGPKPKDPTWVCPECSKEFSSGKALGGHRRIHIRGHKKPNSNKLKSNPTTNFNPTHNNEEPTCSICGKIFMSIKSLFGHMRCHPEREWRGIHPPPVAKQSSFSSVSDPVAPEINNPVDLMEYLPGWPVTAKRGRRVAVGATVSGYSSSEDEELRDAVDDLMRLALLDSSGSGLTQKSRVEEFEATNSNSLTNDAPIEDPNCVSGSKKRGIEEDPVGDRRNFPGKMVTSNESGPTESAKMGATFSNSTIVMDKFKGKVVLENGFVAKKSSGILDCEYESDSSENSSGKMLMKIKKKRKKMKLTDLESVQNISPAQKKPNEFICKTCNKCFPTYQALGGHRSSHNKFKITIINAIDESSSAAAENDQKGHSMNLISKLEEREGENPHQCKICYKNLPTGQALGGHKRSHWTGPIEGPSTHLTLGPKKVLEFDLNEELPMEEEQVAGYGYASNSSYYSNNA